MQHQSLKIIVSVSQPHHPRVFITCISGKALCRPGEAERHGMCWSNTQKLQFLTAVSQTPGGFTLLPFPPRPQLPRGRRRFSARVFLQHSGSKSLGSRSSLHIPAALWRGSLHFRVDQPRAKPDGIQGHPKLHIHHQPFPPCPHRAQFVPEHSSLPGFSHQSQARLFQQGLLQFLGFVFLLDLGFFWFCPLLSL